MDYQQKQDCIIFSNHNFNIQDILECGQCFRYTQIDLYHYVIIAHARILHIQQQDNEIRLFPCTPEDFENIWFHYFDLERHYDVIQERLKKDAVMEMVTQQAKGLRILNQDIWECLISFIISQNSHIRRIQQVVQNISEKFGTPLDNVYTFPTPQQLSSATIEELLNCKTGFRAKYILDAVQKVHCGTIILEDFSQMDTEVLRTVLMSIYGVGRKVADCVLLFSCERHMVFPVDVWIKRAIEQLYFNGKTMDMREIQLFSKEQFGDDAGFAQQYLFYYARQNKIGA